MAQANAEDPSMDDILNTIRGVIAGDEEPANASDAKSADADEATAVADDASHQKEPSSETSDSASGAAETKPLEESDDDDILELTDIIEDGDAMSEAPVNTSEEEASNSEGLLDDIDNMIDAEAPATAEPAAAEPSQAEPAAEAAPATDKPAEVPQAEQVAAEPVATEAAEPEDISPAPEPPAPESDTPVAAADAPAEAEASEAEIPEDVIPSLATDAELGAKDRLMSDAAAATSQAVLKDMMNSIPRQKVQSPATRGGTTLEDLVIEAIRPYLAEWMDENLPTIVKQLVEKEIKHLIPRDVE